MKNVTLRFIDGLPSPPKRLYKPLSWYSLRSITMRLIGVYQRYISPRKGYSCAHRIVYGGDSCSEYVKKTLSDKSLFESTLMARQRFKSCNAAHVLSRDRFAGRRGPLVGPGGIDPELVTVCCTSLGGLLVCCGNQKRP